MSEVNTHQNIEKLFLSNFVHQVINPLNGVIGTLDNIGDGGYSEDIKKQKLNACRGQLEQCVSLIRNLAYLSDFLPDDVRNDAHLKKVRENAYSILPQEVIGAIQFFQISAEKKGIKIELEDRFTQYRIQIRPELLKQVFINIVDNYVKYGLKDSIIAIKTSENTNKELVITVTGKSIGFDNNIKTSLFMLGYRGDEARSKIAQGSGIGLYICHCIVVAKLGGTIDIEHRRKNNITQMRIAIPQNKWSK